MTIPGDSDMTTVWRAAAVLVLAAGCGSPPAEPTKAAPPPDPRAAAAPAEPALTEARAADLVAAVKAAKDKVVVVDFWATWCAPCVKKFPHLVELHQKHADKGLVCVSVEMGKLGEYKPDVAREFLKKQKAAFANFAMLDPNADGKALDAAFGEDHRLLPYLVIFDRGGRRVWDSAAEANLDATPAQIEAKVLELLAK